MAYGVVWPLLQAVGVHPEDIRVVVRVLEAHDGDLAPERHLRDVVHLYGTDASAPEFVGVERVHDPIYIAAVVHVVVHVEVAVLRLLGAQHAGLDLRVEDVHHLGQRVLAGEQRDGERAIGGVLGLAGLEVHQQPARCGLRDGVPLRVGDGVVLEADLVLDDVLGPGGNVDLFTPDGRVQDANFEARDDGRVAGLHHLPEPEAVLLGVGDGGLFHEQEKVREF